MSTQTQPSEWQKRIAGEWHGLPSTFDGQGNHLGYDKVYRSSVFDEKTGRTMYFMNTNFHDMASAHLSRLHTPDAFAFGVIDSDQDRLYTGPDFVGEGQPYGPLVDSHYYSPFWQCDLRTMNLVLSDGKTQVYSSQLFEGPSLTYVFNGIYRVAFDYHTNPDTKAEIDGFLARERALGPRQHVLPSKRTGHWLGTLEACGPDQMSAGAVQATIDYSPIDLLTARQTITLSGAWDARFEVVRARQGNRHTFHGPDLYGNGMSFGRALYTSLHAMGQAIKIKGREFLIDDGYTLCNVWQVYRSDKLMLNIFGALDWSEAA
jgi:hypothetical protein